jgi:hypothetical protein
MKKVIGHRPGGGINSNKAREVGMRNGAPAKTQRTQGVAQIGQSLGNHATDSGKKLGKSIEPVRGSVIPGLGTVPLGNAVAASTVCGPGGSRTVMRSGYQGQHGPANPGLPGPAPRELFPGFPGNPSKR